MTPLAELDVSLLHAFSVLVSERRFTRAARELGLEQSTLSRQMQRLEKAAGSALVVRTPEGVDITQAGKILLDAYEQIREALQSAEVRLSTLAIEGCVRVGAVESCGRYVLPRALAQFRDQWPHVTLAVSHGFSDELESRLVRGELDIILVSGPLSASSLVASLLAEERFVLALPSEGARAHREESLSRPGPSFPLESTPARQHLTQRRVAKTLAIVQEPSMTAHPQGKPVSSWSDRPTANTAAPRITPHSVHGRLVDAIVQVGRHLQRANYRFIAVTPESHRRVFEKHSTTSDTLREIFGWNRWFSANDLPEPVVTLLREAALLEQSRTDGGLRYRSLLRFATIDDKIFAHSAFPTVEPDAVFFGPDTYRFVRFLHHATSQHFQTGAAPRSIVDVGCGSGAGGLMLASMLAQVTSPEVLLTDINPRALVFARANCMLHRANHVSFLQASALQGVGAADMIVANPPYLVDHRGRVYRDGGDALGTAFAARLVEEAMTRLAPGGSLLLYTGAPIVDGRDVFLHAALPFLQSAHAHFQYEEIDPDIFGEELSEPAYASVERIAAVSLIATLPTTTQP